MKISNDLPQFEGENNLLAVTGEKYAEFYLATNGSIGKIAALEVEKPKYTDREGFFETRGQGRTFNSGAVYEPKKQYITKTFQKRFLKEVGDLTHKHNINTINLFTPADIKNAIISFLPLTVRTLIKSVVLGNFTHRHPFELLRLVKIHRFKQTADSNDPVSEDNRKQLFKSLRKRSKLLPGGV